MTKNSDLEPRLALRFFVLGEPAGGQSLACPNPGLRGRAPRGGPYLAVGLKRGAVFRVVLRPCARAQKSSNS
jgi:hypothetical protein